MTTKVNGDTGVSQCQPNSVSQDDLQSGVVGKGPAFAATDAGTTTAIGVAAQIVFDTELFDTGSAFNGTTFQPLVAGYYQVNVAVRTGVNTAAGSVVARLRKNGATFIESIVSHNAASSGVAIISEIIYMNGTTDTLDVEGFNSTNANIGISRFSASLVRAA